MQKRKSETRRKPVPLMASEEAKDYFNIPAEVFPDLRGGYIVTADGSGMVNAGIHSGDLLIMDTETVAQDGDIVAASLGDQFLCRRLFFEGSQIRLRREDGITPDVVTDDCIIRGVLVGLMRNVRKNTAL